MQRREVRKGKRFQRYVTIKCLFGLLEKKSVVFHYLGLFYLKEQEKIQVAFHDGAAAPNISPSTSLPKEGMSQPYMAINSFFELLTVNFHSNRYFLRVIHGHYVELLFFYFPGINYRWCYR